MLTQKERPSGQASGRFALGVQVRTAKIGRVASQTICGTVRCEFDLRELRLLEKRRHAPNLQSNH